MMLEMAKKDNLGHDDANASNACDGPQLSRMACSFCRVRKLKCDKNVPVCGSCSRYRHQCVYESTRKVAANRSRKKGYVSALQERLAQIETSLLKQENREQNELVQSNSEASLPMGSEEEEDVVSQDTIRELEQIYFQKIHESIPMIHKARYMAATELDLGLQPPIYLRHAVLALGACASPKHSKLQERFYRTSREALEFVEMNDHHLDMVSVEQAQTWIMIATYEFRRMHFHRSWLSTGRAVRLVQMMGLHCMDQKDQGSLPPLLPKPKDWTAGEARRRTFWLAFCLDSYAAIGHGWPMTVNNNDIITRLPASDDAFQGCAEVTSLFLQEAIAPAGAASLPSFAGVVVMTAICSRRLTSIRRFSPSSHGDAWRSGSLDSPLIRPFLIPPHLTVPSSKWDPNLYFLNMIAHASTIRVHQEALAKNGIDSLHPGGLQDTERVQLESAIQIAGIMRASCHVDLSAINPFTSFCLYVAARALARTKTVQLDENQKNSLKFLLTAMNSLEVVNPLTTAFIRDLEEEFPDLSASFSGLDVEKSRDEENASPGSKDHPRHSDAQGSDAPAISELLSTTSSSAVNAAFASPHRAMNHEWSIPDNLQFNFDDAESSVFYNMSPRPSNSEDDSFGGMFLFPRNL